METEAVAPSSAAAVESATPEVFAHVPALDGLRGAAVAAVLAYHAGHLDGGYLGVDLFFVLSGYLITSLLLIERSNTGTVALKAFWGRRLRRLMPAFLVAIVAVALYARYLARPVDVAGIRADGFASLAYVANWHDILRGGSYWDISRAPSPLQHIWSLAVEEQFYLLWPLAFAGLARWRGRRDLDRLVLRVAVVGAAISVALFVGLHALGASDSRVYQGTDTRAGALLGGVALAAWRRRSPSAGNIWRSEAVGIAAAVALGAMWVSLSGQSSLLYRGGLPLASALAVVVIAAAADRRSPVLGPVFSFAPLRWLGAISYGLYLWHWPIYQAIDLRNGRYPGLGDLTLSSGEALVAKVGSSLLVAIVSYHLIEMPVRRGFLRDRLPWPAAVGALAAGFAAVAVATAGAIVVPAEGSRVAAEAEVVVDGAPTALFVGDSVAQSVVRPVIADPARYGINPVNRTYPGCSPVAQGRTVRSFAGSVIEPPECFRNLDAELAGIDPDVVFLLIGARPNDALEIDGELHNACDPVFDEAYRSSVAELVRRLGSTGAPVAIGTVARSGAQAIPVEGAEERIACVDRQLAELASEAGATLIDMNELICPGDGDCREEIDGHPIRSDGVHYDDGPGGAAVADWVVTEMLDGVGLAPGEVTATTTTTPGG